MKTLYKYLMLSLGIVCTSGAVTYYVTPSNSVSISNNTSSMEEEESPLNNLSKRFLEVKGLKSSTLSLSLSYEEEKIDVTSNNFVFYIEDIENISLSFQGVVTYNNVSTSIDFTYIDNTMYLKIFDVQMQSTYDDFSTFLSRLGVDFNLPDINFSSLSMWLNNVKCIENGDGYKYYIKNILMDLYFLTDSDYNIYEVVVNKFSYKNINLTAEMKCVNDCDFKELLAVNNKEDYIELKSYNNLIDQIGDLTLSQKAGFSVSGNVYDNENLGFSFAGSGQFDILDKSGNGMIDILQNGEINHNVKIDVFGVDEMLFAYNDELKGKFTINSLNDIIALIKSLMNDNDERFTKFFDPLKEKFATSLLINIINEKDYIKLIDQNILKQFKQTNNSLEVIISGELLSLTSDLKLSVLFTEEKTIDKIVISDLVYGNKTINLSVSLLDFDENNTHILSQEDNYLDFSDIAVLLKFGLKTSKLPCYHLNATAKVSALSIFNFDLNLDFYITVEGRHVKVYGIINDIPLITGVNKSSLWLKRRDALFVYEEGYVHLQRTDTNYSNKAEVTSKKIQENYFVDNIDKYLLGYVLGLNDSIMNKINTSSKNDEGQIKYEKIINDFKFDKDNLKWDISLNTKELAQNDDLGDLNCVIYGNEEEYFTSLNANITFNVGISISLSLNANLIDINQELPEDINLKYTEYILNHQSEVEGI